MQVKDKKAVLLLLTRQIPNKENQKLQSSPMKAAFLISAFKDSKHLKRLVEALPVGARVFVHVDLSVDIAPFQKEFQDNPNVEFIKKRRRIMWGSFTQVEYQMELVRRALEAYTECECLFMLSGLDYPVWSNGDIERFLERNRGRNFLMAADMTKQPKKATREYTRYRFLNNHVWRYGTVKSRLRVLLRIVAQPFLKKKLVIQDPKYGTFRLYKGSDYFCITKELARYALSLYDNSKSLRRYFRTSFAPSETFVHTIAMNSPFASSCILWDKEITRLEDLTPLHFIDYGREIKVLEESDFDRIIASNKMFCRKAVTGKSDALLGLLDERRRGR